MRTTTENGNGLHTLGVYVSDKPGVLARIAQVFARRGFNINSLVVSPSMDGCFSRMTITAKGDPAGLDQIIQALRKLIDVVHCVDHTGEDVVLKELALIKLAVLAESRAEALQIIDHFGGKTVDLTERSLIVMATGNSDKLDALVALLKKFKIIELVRTGKVVMARGEEET
jgi:acetolactate synthase-1/3 small subunit